MKPVYFDPVKDLVIIPTPRELLTEFKELFIETITVPDTKPTVVDEYYNTKRRGRLLASSLPKETLSQFRNGEFE